MNENDLKTLIDIPKNLDTIVSDTLARAKQKRDATNKKKKVLKRTAIAAAIVLSSTVAIGTINPNIASAFPTINKIFETFNTNLFGEPTQKFQDVSETIGQCKNDNGVSITLNEAVLDDNILMLALTVESDYLKGFTGSNENDFFNFDQSITVNGNTVSNISSKARIITDTTGAIILTSNIADFSIDSSADIGLNIFHFNRGNELVTGQWDFNFNIGKQTNGKKITINPNIILGDFKYDKANLTVSDLTTTLILDGTCKNISDSRISSGIIVKDNSGKYFAASNQGSSSSKRGDFTSEYKILGDLSNSEYLEISPKNFEDYILGAPAYSTQPLLKCSGSKNSKYIKQVYTRLAKESELNNGYAFDKVDYFINIDTDREFKPLNQLINSEIEVSSTETITINNVESTDKYTKIFFQSNGLYNYQNFSYTVLFDENMNDTTRGEDGYTVAIEDAKNGLFSMTLDSVDTSKKYKIAIPMMPEVKETTPEWTINIPLN